MRVLGLDPAKQADRLRPQIGSQLQDSALPDRLRVGEAIALFASDRARDAGPLLAQFGLAHLRRSAFAGLSGGEQQRLFLVLALLNRPRLVILDELTQGLDPAARRDVWSAVAQLRDSGTTVLLVTHEMGEAEVLCDRVVVMRAGRVLDAGTPHEVVARHAGGATVRFTWPEVERDAMMSYLRSLPAVRTVSGTGGTLSVQGDRQVIAHVGAALVSRGHIPADLTVVIPNLETAMLGLLTSEPGSDRSVTMTTMTIEESGARRRSLSPVTRLIRSEVVLMVRDPLTLTFVFAFPVLTMLIIGGSFGTAPDEAFENTNPSHWYVASYLSVVIAATGLVTLPVHMASYRERGVLRRFAAAGFPRWSFALAQLVLGLTTILLVGRAAPRRRGARIRHTPGGAPLAGDSRLRFRRGRLRQCRCASRVTSAVGAVGPGCRNAAVLPVLPARRGRSASQRDGIGAPADRGRAAVDPGHQLHPGALARPWQRHRHARHRDRAVRGGVCRRRAAGRLDDHMTALVRRIAARPPRAVGDPGRRGAVRGGRRGPAGAAQPARDRVRARGDCRRDPADRSGPARVAGFLRGLRCWSGGARQRHPVQSRLVRPVRSRRVVRVRRNDT